MYFAVVFCFLSAGFLVASESKHTVSGVTTSHGGQGRLPVESSAVDLNLPVESSAVDLNESPTADMVWQLFFSLYICQDCYPLFVMQYIAGCRI